MTPDAQNPGEKPPPKARTTPAPYPHLFVHVGAGSRWRTSYAWVGAT